MKDYVNITTRTQAKPIVLQILDALIGLAIVGLVMFMVGSILVLIR